MGIPTPHIEAKSCEDFAKTVLMPGDPLRAKYIADTYLTDVVQVNGVRNMLGYTGYYKGKKVTVMGSGMGMPSIGIYSYELFAFYGVENIIRIGSCGSYTTEANIYDVIIVKDAYPVINGRIHSSDVFYRGVGNAIESAGEKQHCLGVEMESFALFANAKFLNKNAACVLTVSDSLVTHEVTSSHERQVSFNKMMEIALESIK